MLLEFFGSENTFRPMITIILNAIVAFVSVLIFEQISDNANYAPGRIIDECKFAEVVALMQCAHNALAVDHHVYRPLQDDVPRLALVTLVKH